MFSRGSLLLSVVALGLAGGSNPVLASAHAAASISNFRVELIDLDPGDGVSPWIAHTTDLYLTADSTADANVSGATPEETLWSHSSVSMHQGEIYTPVSAQISNSVANASAQIGSSWISVQAAASGDGRATAEAIPSMVFHHPPVDFVLSPATELRVSGWLSAYVSAGSLDDWADASYDFELYGADGGMSVSRFLVGGRANEALSESLSEPFEMSYSNASTAWSHFAWMGDVSVSVWSVPGPVSSVPEPASYALMLGGLAVIGLIRRRRQ
ncbi:PEP-CTERM sorting domain-containing protein [Niveibacterium sp. SC-1]|uniref:PEP-CTERM sorting domain-containing protein n=1 Tax=Niveibacterium sp. SC-1 TaxID=3135646 RepID=UPI003120295F